VDSYLGPLFCPTGLHICFCASTMLFLLLWLCSMVWSCVLWYLQHCSFCSELSWLFTVFCASKWTLMQTKMMRITSIFDAFSEIQLEVCKHCKTL
jgi:hypothetical protein